MAKARTVIHFQCSECKNRNYSKMVSKKRKFGKLSLKKFCSKCRGHKMHKEIK